MIVLLKGRNKGIIWFMLRYGLVMGRRQLEQDTTKEGIMFHYYPSTSLGKSMADLVSK